MTGPLSDDDLRRRVQELGQHESASAPPLARVLASRRTRPAVSLWRPAMVLGAVFVVALTLSWWPQHERLTPMATRTPVPVASPPVSEVAWELPTDSLIADVSRGAAPGTEVEQLSREIDGLLEP